jgi:hypothetical protein
MTDQPTAPAAAPGDVEKLLFGGSTASVKWTHTPGTTYRITVTDKATRQRREFAKKGESIGELSTWPDGTPRMQILLTGPCEVKDDKGNFVPVKDPALELDGRTDDGTRVLYISSRSKDSPGSTLDALLGAMRAVKASVLEIGAVITMTHVSGYGSVDDPRVHTATYEAPKPVDAFDSANAAKG